MNQKGFINIAIIIGVVIIAGIAGYFALSQRTSLPAPTPSPAQTPIPTATPPVSTSTQMPQSITPPAIDIKPSSGENLPFDRVSAEVTVLSKIDKKWTLNIDKIRKYARYPKATYPTLKMGDTISVFLIALVEPNNPQMGESNLTPTIGKKYLAQLDMCYSKESFYGCEPGRDWLAYLSSLESTVSAKLKIISPLDGSHASVGQTITIKVETDDPLSRKVLLVTPWAVETLSAPAYEVKLIIPTGIVGPQKILAIGGDRENKDEITITVVPKN